jgi:hypothetical protein
MNASGIDCRIFQCVSSLDHFLAQDLQVDLSEMTDQHRSANEFAQFVKCLPDVCCAFHVVGTDWVNNDALRWDLDFRIDHAIELLAQSYARTLHPDCAHRKQAIGAMFERGQLGVEHDVTQRIKRRIVRNRRFFACFRLSLRPERHLSSQSGPDRGPECVFDQALCSSDRAKGFLQQASLQMSQRVRSNEVAQRLTFTNLPQLALEAQQGQKFEGLVQFVEQTRMFAGIRSEGQEPIGRVRLLDPRIDGEYASALTIAPVPYVLRSS